MATPTPNRCHVCPSKPPQALLEQPLKRRPTLDDQRPQIAHNTRHRRSQATTGDPEAPSLEGILWIGSVLHTIEVPGRCGSSAGRGRGLGWLVTPASQSVTTRTQTASAALKRTQKRRRHLPDVPRLGRNCLPTRCAMRCMAWRGCPRKRGSLSTLLGRPP